jgi:hypothetical protein
MLGTTVFSARTEFFGNHTAIFGASDPHVTNLVNPTARITVETNLLTGAPEGDGGCGDE